MAIIATTQELDSSMSAVDEKLISQGRIGKDPSRDAKHRVKGIAIDEGIYEEEKKEDPDAYHLEKKETQPVSIVAEFTSSLVSQKDVGKEQQDTSAFDFKVDEKFGIPFSSPLFLPLVVGCMLLVLCLLVRLPDENEDFGMIIVPDEEPRPQVWTPLTPF